LEVHHKPVTITNASRTNHAISQSPRNIGKRGGQAGRRELTRQQARLLVAIREAKRVAKKEGKPPPKVDRKTLALLQKSEAKRR
jgi:hypothetical protein